jgi:hypothetical protein
VDLGFLVNIATIFSIAATFAFSLREVMRERRALRGQEPASSLPEAPQEAAVLLRDARLVTVPDADGRPTLTLSVSFAPAGTRPVAPASPPGSGPMPERIAVVNVAGQPFHVQAELAGSRQTAGDEDAGFYRMPWAMRGWPRDAVVETYKWGRLTAGAAARALWLLLLPFQLANVAMWQRLPMRGRPNVGVRAVCRLFALSLTGSFVVTVVGIALDLIAWQCTGPDPRCAADQVWLKPFIDGPLSTPGRRLAILSLVPIAAIAILWQLARRTWLDYDSFPVPEVQTDGDGLAHPLFWRNKELVGRLRALHIAAAFATLDLFVVGTLVPHDRSATGYGLTIISAGILVACVVCISMPSVFTKEPGIRWPDRLVVLLRTVAVLLTATILWYAYWVDTGDWRPEPPLPGYDRAAVWLFVAQLALLVLLTVVVAVQRPASRTFGFGTVLFCAVALGTAAAFAAALLYRFADFLSRAPEMGTDGPAGSVTPATPYQWVGLGFVVLLLTAAIAPVVLASTRRRLRERDARTKTDQMFPRRRRLGPLRAAEIDDAIASARLTDRVVSLLGWACIPLGALTVIGTGLAVARIRPADVTDDPEWRRVLETTTDLGTYLIGVAALGLAVLGVLAYRNDVVRRVIGVVWDLGTFWPRTCHPLSPPCYADRIVPELMVRLLQLTAPEANNAGVVLVGHGQGSVLAAATVLQLPDHVRERVALLTVGSPLHRLYSRLFPAYLNERVLATLAAGLTTGPGPVRWINLWRATDPIGGPVAVSNVDRELTDPVGFEFSAELGHHPPICGHVHFEHDPAFAGALVELAGYLAPGASVPGGAPAAGTVPVVPAPRGP